MDIPFIIVSGSIGDKAAVESMRSGASDYIFKDNLSRLAAAARRELEAADRRKAEARARAESAARLSAIIGSALDAVVSIDEGGRILGWNPQAELMFGWTAQEAVGRLLAETIIPPALPRDRTVISYCTCPDEEASARLTQLLRHDGYDAWALAGGLPAWRAAGYPMERIEVTA